jgi:hypothetical protein
MKSIESSGRSADWPVVFAEAFGRLNGHIDLAGEGQALIISHQACDEGKGSCVFVSSKITRPRTWSRLP